MIYLFLIWLKGQVLNNVRPLTVSGQRKLEVVIYNKVETKSKIQGRDKTGWIMSKWIGKEKCDVMVQTSEFKEMPSDSYGIIYLRKWNHDPPSKKKINLVGQPYLKYSLPGKNDLIFLPFSLCFFSSLIMPIKTNKTKQTNTTNNSKLLHKAEMNSHKAVI